MKKLYKKVGWIFNGIMIGVIIAGLIQPGFTTMVIGATLGLVVAAAIKAATWLQKQRSEI